MTAAARKLEPIATAQDDLDREHEVLRRGSLGNPSATPEERAVARALLNKMLDEMEAAEANAPPLADGEEGFVLSPEDEEELDRAIAEGEEDLRAGRYYTFDDLRAKLRRA